MDPKPKAEQQEKPQGEQDVPKPKAEQQEKPQGEQDVPTEIQDWGRRLQLDIDLVNRRVDSIMPMMRKVQKEVRDVSLVWGDIRDLKESERLYGERLRNLEGAAGPAKAAGAAEAAAGAGGDAPHHKPPGGGGREKSTKRRRRKPTKRRRKPTKRRRR